MIVYLAGPIFGRNDEECVRWRLAAEVLLETAGHLVIDPMSRDCRGHEDELAADIVRSDKEAIDCSDCVLVNASEPSWGTAMEILYAHSRGRVIVAFTGAERISPWLRVHSTHIFWSLARACAWIRSRDSAGAR